MITGLYSAANAMNAAERNHEVVSHNLANANVPGFRKSMLVFETLEPTDPEQITDSGYGVLIDESVVDFSEGVFAPTGRNLDVAINGDGFFVVDGPAEQLFTRNGVMFVQDGQLVNSNGFVYQGAGGPINIPPGIAPSQITISNDGFVQAAGQQLGQLRVASFADNSKLIPAGTTVFQAPADMPPEDIATSVLQGVREQSNVGIVDEMVRMIHGMRQYEAAQRVLKTIDESLSNSTDPQTG